LARVLAFRSGHLAPGGALNCACDFPLFHSLKKPEYALFGTAMTGEILLNMKVTGLSDPQ
jgi:hypothetical protein